MNKKLTILLLNYKRPKNIPLILDSIENQSIDCNIFLWNNSGEKIRDKRISWYVHSNINRYCYPRWQMASFADTPLVMSMDDDLCFSDAHFLELMMEEYEKNTAPGRILGVQGVQLNNLESYFASDTLKGKSINNIHIKHPPEDQYVDIVKGRMMLCKKDDISKLPILNPLVTYADDICVSSVCSSGNSRHHLIPSRVSHLWEDLPNSRDSFSLSQQPNWNEKRTNAIKHFFNT